MSLGSRIKAVRKAKKMTQEELAEIIGISVNYLGAIERGDKLPRLVTFIRIANALEISSDYLLSEELHSKKENMK